MALPVIQLESVQIKSGLTLARQAAREKANSVKQSISYKKPNLAEIAGQLDRTRIPLITSKGYNELSTLFAKPVAKNATHHARGTEHSSYVAAERRATASSALNGGRVEHVCVHHLATIIRRAQVQLTPRYQEYDWLMATKNFLS